MILVDPIAHSVDFADKVQRRAVDNEGVRPSISVLTGAMDPE